MKILYISTSFPMEGTSTIYTDLAEALAERGHEVIVVTKEEKRNHMNTAMTIERGCRVLRVKTGNMYDVGFLEKGLSVITMAWLMKQSMCKYVSEEGVDLILFEAPPVTMASVVACAKKRFGAKAFLMMKDIFPQNAVDIGIMRKNSVVYRYFRHKEKKLYQTADKIGCMSEGNVRYFNEVLGVETGKLSVFPNTKKIRHISVERNAIRKKYNLPVNKVIFIFGGNMGRPQGMEFLANAIIKASNIEEAFFVLVGRGTERKKVKEILADRRNNVVLNNLPREEYEQLVGSCDVGIISLDYRFTIPNYPSRVLAYMECSMPVLGTTDKNTDFRNLILDEAKCGLWCASNDMDAFVNAVEEMVKKPEMRYQLGRNGRAYLEENFKVERSVELLENI